MFLRTRRIYKLAQVFLSEVRNFLAQNPKKNQEKNWKLFLWKFLRTRREQIQQTCRKNFREKPTFFPSKSKFSQNQFFPERKYTQDVPIGALISVFNNSAGQFFVMRPKSCIQGPNKFDQKFFSGEILCFKKFLWRGKMQFLKPCLKVFVKRASSLRSLLRNSKRKKLFFHEI